MNQIVQKGRKKREIPIAGVLLAGLFTIDVFFVSFYQTVQTCGGIVFGFYKLIAILLAFHTSFWTAGDPGLAGYVYCAGGQTQEGPEIYQKLCALRPVVSDRIPGWAFHWLPVSRNRAGHSGSENTRLSIDR